MIESKELKEIGKFQKTHALKGELNALLDIDAGYLEDGFPLIVEMDGLYVPFYPESVRPKGSHSYLVKIEGINDQDEAKIMVNKIIYARKEDIVEYYDDESIVFDDELIGYKVFDSDGRELGSVENVDDSTVNVLLIVRTDDGNEIYLPFVDDLIVEINDEDGKIVMQVPEGLDELN